MAPCYVDSWERYHQSNNRKWNGLQQIHAPEWLLAHQVA